MSGPPPDPVAYTTRQKHRLGLFYCPSDTDALAILAMMGFGQAAQLPPADVQAAQGMAMTARALSGDPSQKPIPVAALRTPDGRLAVVLPTDPRTVMLEVGPTARTPILIMPPGAVTN